jgi:hypothetical protein
VFRWYAIFGIFSTHAAADAAAYRPDYKKKTPGTHHPGVSSGRFFKLFLTVF